jgi:hypothetical protein
MCYRRRDSAAITGHIHDRLTQRFGQDEVFLDVSAPPDGGPFPHAHEAIIKATKVMLVVIGDQWLNIRSPGKRRRRLDDPQDRVRVEVESAIKFNRRILIILADGATLPDKRRLPESIEKLPEYQALDVRAGADFDDDMKRLVTAIEGILKQPESPPPQIRKRSPFAGIALLLVALVGILIGANYLWNSQQASPSIGNLILPTPTPTLPPAPIARFTYGGSGSFWQCTINFDASKSKIYGNAMDYAWDFGDGTTDRSSGPRISHQYTYGGTYTVTLTIEDEYGQTGTASESVDNPNFVWC